MNPILILTLGGILLLAAEIVRETKFPKLTHVTVASTRLKEEQQLRLLQVTDVHNDRLSPSLFKKMEAERPDLIVVTGDMINGTEHHFCNAYRIMGRLKTISPHVYFVCGNNDIGHKNYRQMIMGFEERGVTVLENASTTLVANGIPINIVGVDDPSKRKDRLGEAFAKVTDPALFTVLLAHDPMIVSRLTRFTFDLLLCGHTHGGQIRLPFIGALYAPGQGLFPKWDKGVFRLSDQKLLHIDSGIGTSGPPVRFWNRAQVTMITLVGRD